MGDKSRNGYLIGFGDEAHGVAVSEWVQLPLSGFNGTLAQLVECLTEDQVVGSSILSGTTTIHYVPPFFLTLKNLLIRFP